MTGGYLTWDESQGGYFVDGELVATKRCPCCGQTQCVQLECALGPVPPSARSKTISLGTKMSKNDPFAEIRPSSKWLPGWVPEDDEAFDLSFRVQGSDVL